MDQGCRDFETRVKQLMSGPFHSLIRQAKLALARQNEPHGSSLAAAFPFDQAAELLREALDQPAAEPGVGAARVNAFAVVCDRQAELARAALQRDSDGSFVLFGKAYLSAFMTSSLTIRPIAIA